MAISAQMRAEILEARERGESYEAIGQRFGVTPGGARYHVKRAREAREGGTQRRPGRPRALDDDEVEELRRLLLDRPQTPLSEILDELERRTGKRLSDGAGRSYLRRMGIRRVRPVEVVGPQQEERGSSGTRYLPRHRREGTRHSYPSDATDAEWELLAPVFAPEGGRGRPPHHPRRQILDAVFYVVRSGVPWRMLPRDFPPWQNVYAHFRRWASSGRFEDMHDLLRARWREREGRNPDPSAGIIDSQSVKTTEKGGLGATTPARRPKEGSGTSS